MGVYLSEPATEKHVQEGMGNGMSFCFAEMQGICLSFIKKDGERTCRMQPFTILTSVMEIACLPSLMGMEVILI